MNNNLVPSPIVDKNGRYTTVYRRMDEPASTAVGIPAPIVSGVSEREIEARVKRIMDEVSEIVSFFDEVAYEEAESTVRAYSPELLVRIEDAFQELETSTIAALLIQDGEDEAMVSEFIEYVPDLNGIDNFFEAKRAVMSLRGDFYPGLPESADYGSAESHVKEQCHALMKVTSALKTEEAGELRLVTLSAEPNERAWIIADQRLISLVLERPQDVDLIVKTIKEKHTGDFGVMHAVLHAESLPLADGSL